VKIDDKIVPLMGENYWIPNYPTSKGVVVNVDHVDERVTLKKLNVLNEVVSTAPEFTVKFTELADMIPPRKLAGFQ
jgi:hypothetical protein